MKFLYIYCLLDPPVGYFSVKFKEVRECRCAKKFTICTGMTQEEIVSTRFEDNPDRMHHV